MTTIEQSRTEEEDLVFGSPTLEGILVAEISRYEPWSNAPAHVARLKALIASTQTPSPITDPEELLKEPTASERLRVDNAEDYLWSDKYHIEGILYRAATRAEGRAVSILAEHQGYSGLLQEEIDNGKPTESLLIELDELRRNIIPASLAQIRGCQQIQKTLENYYYQNGGTLIPEIGPTWKQEYCSRRHFWQSVIGEDAIEQFEQSGSAYKQAFHNAIGILVDAKVGGFGVFMRPGPYSYHRVEEKITLELLTELTANDFYRVYFTGRGKIALESAKRVLSLIYRLTTQNTYLMPQEFQKLAEYIQASPRFDDSTTIADLFRDTYIVEYYLGDALKKAQLPKIEESELTPKETAQRLVKQGREEIEVHKIAENMENVQFPINADTANKLYGGLAHLRHLAEEWDYIERDNTKTKWLTEKYMIILIYGKRNPTKFKDKNS